MHGEANAPPARKGASVREWGSVGAAVTRKVHREARGREGVTSENQAHSHSGRLLHPKHRKPETSEASEALADHLPAACAAPAAEK